METPLKTILDKLRAKPDWQHPDPAVRADAVLRLPATEQDALCAIARGDEDARVRRAAVKKVHDPGVLAALAEKDADEEVREEAAQHLVSAALHAQDPTAGRTALGGLREARHLAAVAKAAVLGEVRQAAVAALGDAKALSSVVREADDPAVRLQALARIQDPAILAAIAAKSEVKAVALAAVERVQQRTDLEAIAARARVGAVARRAQALLEATAPPAPEPPTPVFADEQERAAYEKARAAHEREAAARAEALSARDALRETVEEASGEAIPKVIEAARSAWIALAPLPGPESEAQTSRFEQAMADAERRHAAVQDEAARDEKLEAAAVKAEALADSTEPETARSAFAALRREWDELAAGRETGPAGARFEAAADRLRAHDQATREAAARQEKEQRHRLEALLHRAAELGKAEAPSLRDVDHAMHELREALEHAGPSAARREGSGLHHRLESARKALYPRWQQLREDAEWKRWANVAVQEELCAKAEELLQSDDMEATAKKLLDLDARWRQAKEAPKEKSEALWTRFKAARDAARARVDAHLAKQAAELAQNLRRKQELCEKAEALAESTDWLKTADELKKLQEEWKTIGAAPRAQAQPVWLRFRKPCDRFFTRWQEHRAERQQEWTKNLEKKEALCAQAEALTDSTDWETTAAEIRRLQGEWRTAGAVRRSRSDAVWQRFRSACDHFFDRYKNRDELARVAALGRYEAACLEIEALLPVEEGAAPPDDLLARLQAAQTSWRQAGDAPRDAIAPLLARFGAARDRLVTAWPQAFEDSELDPEANRRKMEKLCLRVEALLEQLAPAPASTLDLASRLKDALATNTMGGRAAIEARWNEAAAEVEAARAASQRVGPVPGPAGVELAERFKRACDRFSEHRPHVERPKATEGGRRPRPRP